MGLNLFAYCCNNPVMGYDPAGTINWKNVFKAAAIVVAVTATVALSVATLGTVAMAAGIASATTIAAATAGSVVGGLVAGTSEVVSQCMTKGSDNLDIDEIAIETFGGAVHGTIDGVVATTASVGVRLGCKSAKVITSGVQSALHSAKDGDTTSKMATEVITSMVGSAVIQGGLVILDGATGKLSTSVLESQLRDGALNYGAKQMATTAVIRLASNTWKNRKLIVDTIF